MFRERAYILTGQRRFGIWLLHRQCIRVGEQTHVEAAWDWALQREEKRGDVLGFWHTHPPRAGVAPSLRDVRTMRAWCLALGKPLLSTIACDRQVQTTLFCDEHDGGQPLPITQLFARGVVVVVEGNQGHQYDNQST